MTTQVTRGDRTLELPVSVKLFVDGEESVSKSRKTFTRENPAHRGQTVAIVEEASEDELGRAVEIARRIFDNNEFNWVTNYKQRSKILYGAAQILRRDAGTTVLMVALENGMPIRQATAHIAATADIFEYYAGLADKVYGESIVLNNANWSVMIKEPVGVVAAVTPWNFPMTQAARKIAPALAAGCTFVWKPSSYTPMSAMMIYKALVEAGLPNGAVGVLYGPGPKVGSALVRHVGVDYITFTGETSTGKSIMQQSASALKRVGLELGGKNPGIVFEDADIEEAVRSIVFGGFRNTGQACGAISRVLVHEAVHDRFLNRLREVTGKLVVGEPLNESTDLGPLISKSQEEKVLEHISLAIGAGEKLAFGGGKMEGDAYGDGYYVQPTVFDYVDQKSRLAQEEIFGPVIALIPFRTELESVRMANEVIYGLTAAVFTKNPARAFRVARKLQAGTVWINDAYTQPVEGMWGGYKQSGIGRELGPYGLEEFLERKQVYIDTTDSLNRPHWGQIMKTDKL